jgi:ABC-type transport system involved in multi-copper enzyme maturation permease subunit
MVVAVGIISLLTTLLYGYSVGRRRLWKARILFDTLAGTAVVLFCYILAMIIPNTNDPTASNAAAVGLFILAVPVACSLALVLSVGAGIGHLTLPTIVADPTGKLWTVRVQLIPNRQGIGLYERFVGRFSKKDKKERKHHWFDFILNGATPGSMDDVRILLIILAVAIVFYFIGWPLLLLLLDFIWLILVLIGALISFVILRRPITIMAKSGQELHAWRSRCLLKIRRQKQEIVQSLSRGVIPNQRID